MKGAVSGPLGLSRASWAIVMGGVLMVLGLLWATQAQMQRERDHAYAQADQRSREMVLADEQRFGLLLAGVDKALLVLRQDFLEHGKLGSDAIRARVAQLKMSDGMDLNVGIVSAQGQLLAASNMTPELQAASLDLSDRAYLQHHQTHVEDQLFIDVPVQSRVNQKWGIPVSRRIDDAQGRLVAVVIASVQSDFFSTPYAEPDVDATASRALIGLDGITRVRRTGTQVTFGGDVSKSQLFAELKKSPSGTYSAKAASDGVTRMVRYELIEPYPLVVVAAASRNAADASVAERRSHLVLSGVAIALLVTGLVLLMVAFIERQARSVAKFQQLYEQTPVMHITMALFDGVLKIVQCNRRLQDALGYGHDELIGMPYADLLAPDTRAGRSLTSNIDKVLAGEVILQSRILLAKDGSRVVVLAHVALTPDTLNGVRTARATMVDIGDNIAVRNALLNAEETFQKLIELVPQLVVVHDLQGRTVWCNRQFEAYFGGDNSEAYLQQLAPQLATSPLHRHLRGQDGNSRHFQIQSRPILDADGETIQWMTTCTDIHERTLANEKLLAVQKLEAIGQLTGGLAHDFNNLLALIVGNLDMVKESPNHIQMPQRIDVAHAAAQRGIETVKSLLALASKQPLLPSVVELGALLKSSLPLLRNALGARNTLQVDAAPQAICVKVDEAGLESSILNLLVNARDAMSNGGRVMITLGVEHTAAGLPHACITVRDNGAGMTEMVRRKALDPFFTTKPLGQGTGLGLSMVAGFVNQSHGQLTIDTAPGEGCTVTIRLPVHMNDMLMTT
jgi:PAS domain S-box-containing protein